MIISPKCVSELRVMYSTFSPKVRLVADYIIAHPEDVISCSIQELSGRIGVSQYSILNCVRAIGYHGYSDFKLALAVGTQQVSSDIDKSPSIDDEVHHRCSQFLNSSFESNARCLLDTVQLISSESFGDLIDRIFLAKRISIYGVGTSGYVSNYLCVQLVRLGLHAVSVTDSSYQLLDAATMIENDLLLGFSCSGTAANMIEAFRCAKQQKCFTVAVTSYAESMLSNIADMTLLTTASGPSHSRDNNNSIVEQITLASAISSAVYSELQHGKKRTI